MIRLEPFTQGDFKRLISWIDSEELLIQFAGPIFTYPLTEEQLQSYLEDENRFAFKVIDTNTDHTIGHAEIYHSENNTAKICRVLIGDQSLRGKGFGEKLIRELVSFSIKNLQGAVVELNVFDWNTAAIRCYEKVGFVMDPEKFTIMNVEGKPWKSMNMIFKG